MDEYDVAVRAESGQWILLSPHRPLLPRFAWIMLAWTGATVLVLAPLIYLFRRQLVRPVVELASMAARVSEGGSVDRPPASGPLELRVAADALWEMHLRLDEHIAHQARLLAGMAHDLRTPLTRMHFRLEEALGDEAAPLIRDIEYMDSIIGRALALVRGDDRAAFSEVRLDVLLESVVDDFASAGARVAVTVNGPVRVLGDSLALRRLFSNLLANGVKYGGSVACSLYVEGETAVTVIDDDGPGLAPDVLDRAYEPFFGVRTADGVPPGAGLGLAIVRSVVQSHGGRIALANRTEGGLQATVWLNVLP